MGYLFVNLLFNDLLLSLGYIAAITWIMDGKITEGPMCTAQAFAQHIGDVGSALATLAITIYTFVVLMFPWIVRETKRPWLVPLIVFGMITTFQLLVSLVPAFAIQRDPEEPSFYGPTSYWCWYYSRERVGLEYAIFWIVAIVNIALYIPLFLSLRGNLVIEPIADSRQWWRFSIHWRSVRADDTRVGIKGRSGKTAKKMLIYPIAYTSLILPLSIPRWADPYGQRWSPEVQWFGAFVFSFSGLVNVVLYLTTRPSLFPFLPCGRETSVQDEDDMVMGPNALSDRRDQAVRRS
ncbi:hypothetical protein FRC03_003141 [Tulasnella sp. 419]|nr:hypothetical protein FRC03_003141 [Tulasnella sp. 419]